MALNRRLVCWVDRGFPVTVVRLRGVLGRHSAPQLRDVLERCLVEEPDTVVVDLSRLRFVDGGQAALGAVLGAVPDWSGSLVLCSTRPAVTSALHRAGPVPVYDTCREARDAALRQRGPGRLREHLLPDRHAPRSARELVRRACVRWNLPGLLGTAQLLVSELVCNAVRHAGTSIDLTVWRSDRFLHLVVGDRDRVHAVRPRQPALTDDGGRGLLLVQSLAAAWGTAWTPAGKVVWASVRV